MIRKIIHIDTDKCSGCGLCAKACHEGAIGIVDGKAKLLREDYCDGLGDCLPACPEGAITFIAREALAYDEAAVKVAKETKIVYARRVINEKTKPLPCGCPGSEARKIKSGSGLSNFPIQLHLVPETAEFLEDCNLLIASDCSAYAYSNFHRDFIDDRVTLIGCPKLDSDDYAAKLTRIFSIHNIRSVTLTRMMVPCCGGMERAVREALEASGSRAQLKVVTIDSSGTILS